MDAMGFARDKVDWFVRTTADAHRQQEHKWAGGDFIGIGVSAYGVAGGVYYRNEPSAVRYMTRVGGSGMGVHRAAKLSTDQSVRRRLMLGIKRGSGVRTDVIDLASAEVRRDVWDRVGVLKACQLAVVENGRLRLTGLGAMYGDSVAEALSLSQEDRDALRKWRLYDSC